MTLKPGVLPLVLIGLLVAGLAASLPLSRPSASTSTSGTSSSQSDLAPGGVSRTDRQIGTLQERLRQQPGDHTSATRLGLAYLQRAREASDPSYYTRADGILHQALTAAPDDTDTLIGLGALALARHQFQDALDWGQRAVAVPCPAHVPSDDVVPHGTPVLSPSRVRGEAKETTLRVFPPPAPQRRGALVCSTALHHPAARVERAQGLCPSSAV